MVQVAAISDKQRMLLNQMIQMAVQTAQAGQLTLLECIGVVNLLSTMLSSDVMQALAAAQQSGPGVQVAQGGDAQRILRMQPPGKNGVN